MDLPGITPHGLRQRQLAAMRCKTIGIGCRFMRAGLERGSVGIDCRNAGCHTGTDHGAQNVCVPQSYIQIKPYTLKNPGR